MELADKTMDPSREGNYNRPKKKPVIGGTNVLVRAKVAMVRCVHC